MAEHLKQDLGESSCIYQRLLQQTHTEALAQNEVETNRWQEYKKEHEEVRERMMSLKDKLSHSIMVPLGNKAIMRGYLVHTNEILVCIGQGYFVKQTAKQAAEICQRRIQHSDEMIEKLTKEEKLLTSRKSLPFKVDAFCDEQTQELIEPYIEEAEKQWRERHRQKEKEYHQKLAELRKSQTKKIQSEEDIWLRLDVLELQEELEDEMNRVNEGIEFYENDSELSEMESDTSSIGEDDKLHLKDIKPGENTEVVKRRVSFKENTTEERICARKTSSDDEDVIRIHFAHSNNTNLQQTQVSESEILSPADIGRRYMKQWMPKSILKPTVPVDNVGQQQGGTPVPNLLLDPSYVQQDDLPDAGIFQQLTWRQESIVKAVNEEVIEKSSVTPSAAPSERPASRFKASRMASKT